MKNRYVEAFVPYLVAGFSIAIAAGLLLMIFNIFIWGIAIGAILWVVITIKNLIMEKLGHVKKTGKHQGIIIDHDDIK